MMKNGEENYLEKFQIRVKKKESVGLGLSLLEIGNLNVIYDKILE